MLFRGLPEDGEHRKPRIGIRRLKDRAEGLGLQPETLDPKPYTLDPKPYTLNPKP